MTALSRPGILLRVTITRFETIRYGAMVLSKQGGEDFWVNSLLSLLLGR